MARQDALLRLHKNLLARRSELANVVSVQHDLEVIAVRADQSMAGNQFSLDPESEAFFYQGFIIRNIAPAL